VPNREHLEDAVAGVDRPWSGGPYAELARSRLAEHAGDVRVLLARFDELLDRVDRTGAAPVLTHGEPHPGNVVFADGRVLVLDWDTVGLALPERDLWMLDNDDERARYTRSSGRVVDDAAIRLYRLRWHLDDISYALHRLRSAPAADPDTERSWRWFAGAFESNGPTPYGHGVAHESI